MGLNQLICMVVSFAERANGIESVQSKQVRLSVCRAVQRPVMRNIDSTNLLYQECNRLDASNMLRSCHGVPHVLEKHYWNFVHDDILGTDWIVAL
jgi:hypothetical protein